jgi:transposase
MRPACKHSWMHCKTCLKFPHLLLIHAASPNDKRYQSTWCASNTTTSPRAPCAQQPVALSRWCVSESFDKLRMLGILKECERLDIVPAQFFVHRHIRGKWACKCCQILVQEPVQPQIIDSGIPTSGLVAHTLVSRFVDHLPYYRQEAINARSGVHTPRSTLAAWSGRGGAALQPLFDMHREFVLGSQVLHADETPVEMLDPGAGKTKKAYVWAYARGGFDASPGVVYDFSVGRGAKYPMAFLPD